MEVKLIISADDRALKFAKLLGGLFDNVEITTDASASKEEDSKGIVGTEPTGYFVPQEETIKTAPIDNPGVISKEIDVQTYTANELREVALKVPKTAECQQEIARILQSSCAEGSKASISNILPEHSYQAMQRLKTLAGVE